ncbi:GDSL-like lipase/acylhydrolase family protein [Paenibacillus cellulosilyticus]|uniref:GDSL-like lipase/acylhydrolase family protein n=1 Tax=Paenibacillus cellulosilyticus TaxID=375489 RepID=A0A2V2Z307_9BACL|nr:SGNH/GDSL hydrolase family protein [Paenibacillus cellulosilyticus]PWW08646.1 GDSL-like lipase/acylhydrolase family protein [Paenibacillus cellulosilyticus]QKS48211.1 SGNH/GDSL hydrolase family protein [Paenibacillus cellulosilyticus]
MRTDEQLRVHALTEIENLKIHGRTTGRRSPLTLFWTGSAMELNAKGTELWVEVEAHYSSYEPWISIVINGAAVSRQMVTDGRRWICVFRGMNGDTVKNVRIIKDMQAMSGDPQCSLQVHAVRFDGEFLPVEDKPCKVEFIGDSITSGEGAIGAQQEADWIPMWFSALDNYTAMTADALNADYRVVSQSGWGVLTSWDNNPYNNIPAYYEQVCGLLKGADNEALGAHEPYDCEAWRPDVVVVNLGTNDGGAFHSPEWRNPSTGKTHKQRLNEYGSYNEEDLTAFEAAAEQFLVKLRRNNRDAHIVWAYGMLGTPMLPAISRAVDAYSKQSGDRKVTICELPNMTEATVGARSHPGKLGHQQAAEALAGHIQRLLSRT